MHRWSYCGADVRLIVKKIFLKRDGVGDGQIPYMVEHELAAIERCFEKVVMDSRMNSQPSNPPSWTVVVVVYLAIKQSR